ncbi:MULTISPECIES: hypothetical protein [unclassified Nocardia]|uniref:hypothetical protein n=1 Tax=unclassified Nocardia TaxID=2637762 RepID=UPI001CE4A437|nr:MULTISPECIES: hypothetical protein [unclassified Nocardia]
MTDRSTPRFLDEVPEADFAEQSVPAYPDDGLYTDDATDDTVDEVAALIERDAFSADPADIVEQSIPVPLDDEPDQQPVY